MKENMVSIVVPIYNIELYLLRCIDSILAQTFRNLEIILVDDGSPDACPRICEEYARKDARIRVIHKQNGGLVSARKAGVEAASGEYIGFVDGDDWIESNMIEAFYQTAVKYGADVVLEGIIEDADGECHFLSNKLPDGIYRTEEERAYLYRNMLCYEPYFAMGLLPYLHNKLFRRTLLLEVINSMDDVITVGEDAAVLFPTLLGADCIVIQNQFHYHYCLRSTSMTRTKLNVEKEWSNAVCLHRYLEKRFGGKYADKYNLQEQLENYTMNNLLVRAYGICSAQSNSVLSCFKNVEKGDSIIVYGAGAFGRAVYQYVSEISDINIVGWADREFVFYRKLGYPVDRIEDLKIDNKIKIIVAILQKKVINEIRETLLQQGIRQEQIAEVTFGIDSMDVTEK